MLQTLMVFTDAPLLFQSPTRLNLLELFLFIPPHTSFRFWSFVFPEKKPNYLKALSNIVNKLPKQVQVTELPAVSPQQTPHVNFCKQRKVWFHQRH